MSEHNEPRDASSGGLADALRRYVDAITGFTDLSRERAERIMADLTKRGESRAKDLERSARELYERSAQNRDELVGLVQKEIRRQVDAIGIATRDEIERLQRRVKDLEARRSEGDGTDDPS